MKVKVLMLSLLLLLLSGSYVNGLTQEDVILNYQFEENCSVFVIDKSMYNNDGLNFGATCDDTIFKFGNASLNYGINQQLYTISNINNEIADNYSLSFWVYERTNDYQIPLTIYNTVTNMHLSFIWGYDKNLEYKNSAGTTQSIRLDSGYYTNNEWYHIGLNFDFNNSYYEYYVNNVLVSNGTINDFYKQNVIDYNLRLGNSIYGSSEFDGNIDSFYIINDFLNDTQRNDLYLNNSLGLTSSTPTNETTNETVIEDIEKVDLIVQSKPSTETDFYSNDKIFIETDKKSYCEVYIDNSLYAQSIDFSFYHNFIHDLELQNYTAMIYCYYDKNNVRYYDTTGAFDFEVKKLDSVDLNFFINGLDFTPTDYNLYIVTPCIKDIIQVGDLTKDILQNLNKDKEYYIQKVSSSQATFNLTPNNYDFCIINGQVQYGQNDFTNDFNINKVEGVVELGKFKVENNITNSYTINLEIFDIYGVSNPKAWGQTWAGVIGGILMLVLGAIVLLAGVSLNNGKVVIGGVILVGSALGVSFAGFLGVLL